MMMTSEVIVMRDCIPTYRHKLVAAVLWALMVVLLALTLSACSSGSRTAQVSMQEAPTIRTATPDTLTLHIPDLPTYDVQTRPIEVRRFRERDTTSARLEITAVQVGADVRIRTPGGEQVFSRPVPGETLTITPDSSSARELDAGIAGTPERTTMDVTLPDEAPSTWTRMYYLMGGLAALLLLILIIRLVR